MYAYFNRFEIKLTKAQALACSHPGPCDEDVAELLRVPSVARMLAKINPDDIRSELKEYGAWSEGELANDQENLSRILWIAAGNIAEESK